jgi:C1A family cysteine protease
MENTFTFGWRRDLPDHRDVVYSVNLNILQSLPQAVDLRPQCPPVYDQGRIGSCTANAIAGAIQFNRNKNAQAPSFLPSRLFIYYNERVMEGTTPTDSGAFIRDGIKSTNKEGVCPESSWTYDDTPAPFNAPFPPTAKAGQKPPANCYTEALNYQVTSYQRLNQSLSQLRGCLAEGFPFVFGFSVYSSFFDSNNQPEINIPLPSLADSFEGGHAVMAVGYDNATQMFIIRNSWGPTRQDKGYFYMPYSYLTDANLSADFWVIHTLEN